MAAAAGSGESPKEKSPTPAASRKASKADQVRVEVKTVGAMRQPKASKFWVSRTSKFGEVVRKLRKGVFKTADDKELFIYVQQAFSPAADESMGDLFDHFCSGSSLVLYCGEAEAYG